MSERPIYLDYNATTPPDPEVAEAMLPYLTTRFGNPSSSHAYGAEARAAVEAARRQVAALLGARAEEIVFTSGGTEGNNTVLHGVARLLRAKGRHVVTSAIEHPAVLEPCAVLEEEGFRITRVPVDGSGRVDPRDVAEALTPETILVSVMHANNEVGTIQDIAEIARLAHEHGVLVHTDAAQSIGKVPVDVEALGVDFLTLAGHKLYAPKGVGALYIRSGVELPRLLHGASHEAGRRAGTENVLEIVGLGKACEVAARRLPHDARRFEELRERLFEALSREVPGLRRNSPWERCLPNTLSVGFPGVDAGALLTEIGEKVAASAGAACHAAGVEVSTVLAGDGRPGRVRDGDGPLLRRPRDDPGDGRRGGPRRRRGRPPDAARTSRPLPPTPEGDGPVRLTRFTRGMGCACKLRPQDLETVLKSLPKVTDPAVLVGPEHSDDAAVYRLTGRPRDRLDRRLLHADRRRPVRLRRDQRRELAERRLRDGGEAALRAERRRLPLAAAPPLRPRADPRRGGRGRARGGHPDPRRAHRRRHRAEVRPRGDGGRPPRPRPDERRRPAPATRSS